MNEPFIEFSNITKKFPKVIANNKVSFNIKKSSVHALLGENGAGKSTLVKILYGLLNPDSGEILYNNNLLNITSPSDARKKGWESEGQNTTANKSTSTEGDTSSEKPPSSASQAPTPTEKIATKPAPKKPTQKNPYSGGKKSRAKTAT